MRKFFLVAILVLLVLLPFSGAMPVSAQSQGKALILSSLEKYVPMGYADKVQSYLMSAGYQVTFVQDTAVTLNLLTTQLNNYDVIIWRTNVYIWAHTTYWYVGELTNQATLQAYAADLKARRIDNTNGILGVSVDFFYTHFKAGSLGNVKLAVLVSSMSATIAQIVIRAGVKSVVYYWGSFSLSFNLIDYVTTLVLKYLANGNTVKESVQNTVSRFLTLRLEDPLDSTYLPPIWYMGNSATTIT